MTIPEAASALGVTEAALRIAITKGRLNARGLYGRRLIHVQELAAYKARTQPEGVPRVKGGRPPGSKNRRSSTPTRDDGGAGTGEGEGRKATP